MEKKALNAAVPEHLLSLSNKNCDATRGRFDLLWLSSGKKGVLCFEMPA